MLDAATLSPGDGPSFHRHAADVSVLHPTTAALLTLITCHPPYSISPAPERLVVFSRLVDDDKQQRPRDSR